MYIANNFDPSGFGVINFSTVFISYFMLISTLGLPSLGIIKATKDPENTQKYVNQITSLRIILSVVALCILIVIVPFLNQTTEVKAMILINGITIFTSAVFIDWIFQALQKMSYVGFAALLRNVIYGIGVVVPLATGMYTKIYLVPIAQVVSSIIGCLFLWSIYRKQEKAKFKFDFNLKDAKILVLAAVPFFFSGVFATFNSNIDILMIGIFKTKSDVGLYSAVYKIINILTIFVSFIFTPLYPYLIKYFHNEDYLSLDSLVAKLSKFVYILAFPMLAGGLLLRENILLTLYSAEYYTEEVKLVYLVLIIQVFMLFGREIYGYELTAWGLQKKYMQIVMISSVYNIISNIIFIPMFGIVGAAVNTVISEIVNFILMRHFSRKTYIVKQDFSYIYGIIFATIIMSSGIFLIKVFISKSILVLIPIGIVLYAITILVSRVLSKEEINYLLRKE